MGTLGIPYAIKVGGLSSIIYIVVIALVTCYTSGLIIEAQYDERSDVSKEPEETQRVKSRHGYAAVGMYIKHMVQKYPNTLTTAVLLL